MNLKVSGKMNNINFYKDSQHISEYNGVMSQQRPEAFSMLSALVKQEEVSQIIEIGTFHGGLSLYLADLNLCEVYTFDITDHNKSLPERKNLHRFFYDSFSLDCKNFITSLTKNKKTMWLFDGGNKKREVIIFYSDIIKEGELAMAHDFAPDRESFSYLKNNNIWLWHESDSSAFDPNIFEQHPDFESIWKTCVWGCFRKKK